MCIHSRHFSESLRAHFYPGKKKAAKHEKWAMTNDGKRQIIEGQREECRKQIEVIIKEKRTEKMEGINQRYNREFFLSWRKSKSLYS